MKALLLCILLFTGLKIQADTIHITNGEWEPYLSEYSYQYGLASHIVSEAFKNEGIEVVWGFFPWKRSYVLAQIGDDWDASAVWWPTEEVKKDFLVSLPVVTTSHVFFYRKEMTFDWETVEDLKGLQIGFTLGYDYGQEFMAALANNEITVQRVSSDELNFKKLLLGRIDIFPNDPVVGYAQMNTIFSNEQMAQITHHSREFNKTTLNLIISKKSIRGEWLLEKFNAGLKKLEESGRLREMLQDFKEGRYSKQKTKWRAVE